ncbi:SLAP domain-containing protein [Companilactobacillus sp.]|uniref:SLAP domain-containing protein n=1 Tax=Companilactobacillus sp. TaxID=2767905 RepID=UPI0025C6265F|nr:SLAP domain-containing protein [Companilactobacillus sp.]MCH4009215.1 SLAP domain-containing protein [Companilactobacillus sp.]MCH4050606.1 SLAP domain-containing protein [Companilactobacillus sp.]MCH4077157.1 SLAP domain-containing protein [Companilactobacillus sp.]MCH4125733.1 SLAP domain-containing protein [Companilactobacillus sp.]MCI1311442.1 SLAP domain-containing protein [Companilactobacillus sp.]
MSKIKNTLLITIMMTTVTSTMNIFNTERVLANENTGVIKNVPDESEFGMQINFRYNGHYVDNEYIRGVENQEKDIMELVPDGYKLTKGTSSKVIMHRNASEGIFISVEPVKHTLKIKFVDESNSFKEVGTPADYQVFPDELIEENEYIDQVPDGYVISKNAETYFYSKKLKEGAVEEHKIYVKKNLNDEYINTIQLKDEMGGAIGTPFNVKGKKNEIKILDSSHLPDGYVYRYDYSESSSISYKIIPKETIQYITIMKRREPSSFIQKEIKFINSDGKIIGNYYIHENDGQRININSSWVPNGYKLKNPNQEYVIQDDGKSLNVNVDEEEKVTNKFKIVDEDDPSKVLKEIELSGPNNSSVVFKNDLVPGYGYRPNAAFIYFEHTDKIKTVRFSRKYNNMIFFVTFDGTVVGKKEVSNFDGWKVSLTAPKGYEFPANYLDSIYISKENKKQRVVVLKLESDHSNIGTSNIGGGSTNNSNSTNSNSTHSNGDSSNKKITNHVSFIGIHFIDKTIPLFDSNGKISNRQLASNTDWAVDKKMVLNGETYFRVSSNEWVKAAHVYEYQSINGVIETQNKISKLYDSKGKLSVSRSLGPNSRWLTDKSTMINGQKYYRVSTNEWLSANDVK